MSRGRWLLAPRCPGQFRWPRRLSWTASPREPVPSALSGITGGQCCKRFDARRLCSLVHSKRGQFNLVAGIKLSLGFRERESSGEPHDARGVFGLRVGTDVKHEPGKCRCELVDVIARLVAKRCGATYSSTMSSTRSKLASVVVIRAPMRSFPSAL